MWSNIISRVVLMSELINNKLCFYEPFEIISSDCQTASNTLIAGAIALITQKKWFVVTTYHSNIERTDDIERCIVFMQNVWEPLH